MAEEKVLGVKPTIKAENKTTVQVYENIFTLVTKENEQKTYIAIRNSIIWREGFENVEEAKKFIDSKPWGLIVNTVLFINEDIINNIKK